MVQKLDDNDRANVIELLNSMLGIYWLAAAQHQSHVAILRSLGVDDLAESMQRRIDDEPQTIAALTNRILDLNGEIDFEIGKPNIGTDLRSILENDIAIQRDAPAGLNAASEAAGQVHDATTRTMIETIVADEEQHLGFLERELSLLERLGDALYLSNRM